MALESAKSFAMRKSSITAFKEKQRVYFQICCRQQCFCGKNLIYGLLPDLFLPAGSAKAVTFCNFFTILFLCVDLLNKRLNVAVNEFYTQDPVILEQSAYIYRLVPRAFSFRMSLATRD